MSNEAKFTKGPWASGMHNISDAEGYNVEYEGDCGWSYIGTSKKCIAMAVTKSHLDAELDANTSLIAAAPEMYELLSSIENDANQIPRWLWDKIQKTLAKARGE